jgi:hypothetical protein
MEIFREDAVAPIRKFGAGKRIRSAAKDTGLEVETFERAGDVADELDDDEGIREAAEGGDDEEEDADVGEGDVGAAVGDGIEDGDLSQPDPGHHGRKKLSPARVYCRNKCTLGALINYKSAVAREFIKEVNICVDGTTRTAIEAARFLNYFITRLLVEV